MSKSGENDTCYHAAFFLLKVFFYTFLLFSKFSSSSSFPCSPTWVDIRTMKSGGGLFLFRIPPAKFQEIWPTQGEGGGKRGRGRFLLGKYAEHKRRHRERERGGKRPRSEIMSHQVRQENADTNGGKGGKM